MFTFIMMVITAIIVGIFLIVVIPMGIGNTIGNVLMGTNTGIPKTTLKEFYCEDLLLLFNDTTTQTSGYWHRRMEEREKRWDKRVNKLKNILRLK